MRVLFVTSSTTTHGGGSKSFLQMLKGLIPYGIDPLVILPDNNGLYHVLQQAGIMCIALKYPYRLSIYPPKKSSWIDLVLYIPRLIYGVIINSLSCIQLLKISKHFNPDIIHTNVSVTAIGYYVARLLNIPHIWHIREYADLDFNFHYFPSKRLQLHRYRRPNSYTICITKDIQKHHALNTWSQSAVIYNGILPEKELYYQKNKKPYFLFAGRIEQAKGILFLIDAYADYYKRTASPIPLYIAGSGTNQYVKLVQDKISQHQITDHVVFLGMKDDILSLYREATAIIIPSISEGFGRITAEAMFSGCLVIGNDTAGTKEQFDIGKEITGEEIGLRYTTRDSLVQHMIDVTHKHIETYESMILRGQKTAATLYSTEQHAKYVYEFYKNIVLK
jgi:glycosyltransferase involved in cell wall biosynthesis